MLTMPFAFANLLVVVGTIFLVFFRMKICTSFGLMDVPDERKLHRHNTPLLGGLALALVILPSIAISVWFGDVGAYRNTILLFTIATMSMAFVGLADDRHSLSATARIAIAGAVFGILATADPTFSVRILNFEMLNVRLGVGSWLLSIAFTVLCCVGLVNAVNMADGKNGLVISLCIGWLLILSYFAPPELLFAIVPLCVALTILLILNLRGLLFLGDGGSYGFATAVGLLTIIIYNTSASSADRQLSAEDVMLMLSVPVLDSFRLTYVRIRNGRSPMSADRDHLHHYLQDALGWPQGLVVYLIIALLPAAVVTLL